MPIPVDPSFVWPDAPTTTTSTDGRLAARVDSAHGGVLLRADFTGDATEAVKARFYRGDGSLVRSGDPAMAPGGVALAYDHEAPVGETQVVFCGAPGP